MSAHVVDTADDLIIDLRDHSEVFEPTLVHTLGLDIETPSGPYHRFVKPAIDRTVAAVLLLVLLPALLGIAIVLRLRLGKGVLFRQERVGLHGRRFTVLKFRTMLPDRRATRLEFVGEDRRRTHKTVHDPRHTRVGQFLRKWSLDELPQIVDRYEPWEHARHAVRPGLTGFWQTTARVDGPMKDFTHLDLEYVRTISFATDVRLLLATPIAALGAQKGC